MFRVLLIVYGCAVSPFAFAAANAAPGLPASWSGTWWFSADLGAPGVTALTDTEARAIIGRKVRLGVNATFAGVPCEQPRYTLSRAAVEDVLSDYRATRATLPLMGKSAEVLEAACKDGTTRQIVRLETGCVVLAVEGRFFQIRKLPPKDHRSTGAPRCMAREK